MTSSESEPEVAEAEVNPLVPGITLIHLLLCDHLVHA